MSGHVFIVRGDLRRFACDAWLASGSRSAVLDPKWVPPNYTGSRHGEPFVDGGARVRLFDPGSSSTGADPHSRDRPQLWLGWIGRGKQPVSWYTDGVVAFLETAARSLAENNAGPLFGRARSLLALPVVGTDRGGGAERAGEIVQALLPVLEAFVARAQSDYGRGFDVALVCFDAAGHAAAQAERAAADKAGRSVWPEELKPGLRADAEALAGHARHGHLALFLGAGVSLPAGLPRWKELIGELATHAGMSDLEQKELGRVGSRAGSGHDRRAARLERRTEKIPVSPPCEPFFVGTTTTTPLRTRLPRRACRCEVITTNYDQLFDRAWGGSPTRGASRCYPTASNPTRGACS